jgi:hypothetical protein
MGFQDIILIPALLIPIVPAVLMGLKGHGWFYLFVWIAFYIFFGICEMLSKKFRNKTISKDIAETPPYIFWSIVGSWLLLACGLSLHWFLMR